MQDMETGIGRGEADPQQVLFDLLDDYAIDGNAMRLDEIQAFLLAWLSGPDDAEEYFDLVWGEIVGKAALDEGQKRQAADAIRQWMDVLRQDLAAGGFLQLLIFEDEDGQGDFFSWCNAYLYALDITPTDWFAAADEDGFVDLFYPISALAGVYDDDMPDNMDEWEAGRLQNELPYAVKDIAAFWRVLCNKPETVRRKGKKVGRNDPCPCGSGKKYKACCGRGS